MKIFGGGYQIDKTDLRAGDWVYHVGYENKFFLSKIIHDDEGELIILDFTLDTDSTPSVSYLINLSHKTIKLATPPCIDLLPTSIKSSYGGCKTGYCMVDKDGVLKMALKPQHRASTGYIQWVDFKKNKMSPMVYKSDSDVYYTEWKLKVISHDELSPLLSIHYGANT